MGLEPPWSVRRRAPVPRGASHGWRHTTTTDDLEQAGFSIQSVENGVPSAPAPAHSHSDSACVLQSTGQEHTMNLTEALQKNGGYANNRSIATTIQVTGEWGYAAGEQNG